MRTPWLFLLVLAGAASPALAADVPDLYAATVSAQDKSVEARGDAMRRALGEVMVRVVGDPKAPRLSGADQVLEQARSLVQQYAYQGRSASGFELRAVFGRDALEKAMREAGLPVWGQSRPETLAWILNGDELVTRAGPTRIVEAVKETAERRGVRLRFPRSGALDSGRVTAADIRNGNIARIMSVSRGYGTGHVLIGAVDGNTADWRLVANGNVVSSWGTRGGQPAELASEAVGHSTDVYARRYASTGGDSGRVTVAIDGIGGGRGYTRVTDFLSGLTAVDAVTPILVDGKTVVFRVAGPGKADALDRRIGLANWLSDNQVARNLAGLYAGKGPSLGYSVSE